jgi:hypothetical protein
MKISFFSQADFLNPEQRQCWADYLSEQNIGETKFAFFSAIQEDDEEDEEEEEEGDDVGEEESIEEVKEPGAEGEEEGAVEKEGAVERTMGLFPDPCEILSSDRLLQLFRSFKRHHTGRRNCRKNSFLFLFFKLLVWYPLYKRFLID